MKTTVKHVGSDEDRNWEGPEENWLAHKSVIIHWCDGGEVEYSIDDYLWIDHMNTPADFHSDVKYRIKQREPKAGEVWVEDHCIYLLHINGETFFDLEGCYMTDGSGIDLTYAAPSVEAYYARKFMECTSESMSLDAAEAALYRVVDGSTREDR